MYTSLLFILALFSCSRALDVDRCNGSKRVNNSKCYTCPQLSSLSTSTRLGIPSAYEDVSYICYAEEGDSFACKYRAPKYYDDPNKKEQNENYLGQCKYDSNGKRGSESRSACPKNAPIDNNCIKDKEQSAFNAKYFKPCKEKGCGHQTAMCYTCPVDKGAESVHVDTRNRLQCAYYHGTQHLNTCQYDANQGTLVVNTTAEDKAAKAKDEKKYDEEKSALAVLCEGFVRKFAEGTDKRFRDIWLDEHRLPDKVCRNPDKALETLDSAEFFWISKSEFTGKLRKALIGAGFRSQPSKANLKCASRANLDTTCENNRKYQISTKAERARQVKEAADKKAARYKKFYADKEYDEGKSALTHLCEGFVREFFKNTNKTFYKTWMKEERLPHKVCRNPDKALETLDSKPFRLIGINPSVKGLRQALIDAGFKRAPKSS